MGDYDKKTEGDSVTLVGFLCRFTPTTAHKVFESVQRFSAKSCTFLSPHGMCTVFQFWQATWVQHQSGETPLGYLGGFPMLLLKHLGRAMIFGK